jgi:hypothetical protein
LIGSGGAMLCLLLLPIRLKTFFFVQTVAREYLLDGDVGLFGYGGEEGEDGDAA